MEQALDALCDGADDDDDDEEEEDEEEEEEEDDEDWSDANVAWKGEDKKNKKK